ncbi:M16 family metallopeptidase [Actinocatenispora comari]|uniref:Putative zinc protease n=1 Tax=Actinocatenispora comari TaxID=2807577 RepID=A0A8J4EJK3_9ACTN|nr:pitrilysin family protein [Actinocatenispora comari]GIL25973.1 putative zinc protease [Actinocatenispora comari]
MSERAKTRTLVADPLSGAVRRTVLPGGLRVITEAVPAMRSAAVGVWVGVGSRDESPRQAGASHFLEHLLFKGTERRSALDISAEIEAVGGETNAFTTKEYTCYYARVLDDDLPLALDVLGDLITSSVLAAADVETERGVILEEIAMTDDEPGDVVHDRFAEAVFGDRPLGRLVSGTTESVSAMSRRQILDFYHRRYAADRIVVAVAGNLEHRSVLKSVRAAFGPLIGTGHEVAQRRTGATPQLRRSRTVVDARDTEQAHLVLGSQAYSRGDQRRFALGVLNAALGGGMSSRLFQEVREKRGLAYSVYSFGSHFADTGLFGVYAGCAPGKADEVLSLVSAELSRVAADGLTTEEVSRGKGMVKGSLVLGLEDTGSRMTRLGKGELLYRDLLSVDELLTRIDQVTPDEVAAVAADLMARPMSLAVVGPFAGHDFDTPLGWR